MNVGDKQNELKKVFETKTISDDFKKEIIELWEKLGFLDGFKNKFNLALAFEIEVYLLMNIKDEDIGYNKNFKNDVERKLFFNKMETTIFPIIRKIFEINTNEDNMTIDDIFDKVSKIHIKYITSDHDAEYCSYFSKNFIF